VRQREQRHLPRDAAIAVRVPVELVHHHVVDPRVLARAQGHVGENLGRAAQDGRVAVDRGVARREPDLVGPEFAAQRHPFLVDERLDGARVDRALAAGERGEQHRRRHQRLAGPGRRVEDDVLLVQQFEHRLFLGGVERQALRGGVVEEAFEQHIGGGAVIVGKQVAEPHGHLRELYLRTFVIQRGRDQICKATADDDGFVSSLR